MWELVALALSLVAVFVAGPGFSRAIVAVEAEECELSDADGNESESPTEGPGAFDAQSVAPRSRTNLAREGSPAGRVLSSTARSSIAGADLCDAAGRCRGAAQRLPLRC